MLVAIVCIVDSVWIVQGKDHGSPGPHQEHHKAGGSQSTGSLTPAWRNSKGNGVAVFRVGLTITKTHNLNGVDAEFLGPPHPQTINNSLELWRRTINQGNFTLADGRKIYIEIHMGNDLGIRTAARSFYAEMMHDVDVFFCPSQWKIAQSIFNLLNKLRSTIPLICWVTEDYAYFLPPISDTGNDPLLEQRAKLGISFRDQFVDHKFADLHLLDREPDGDMWRHHLNASRVYTPLFDVNVPRTSRMNHVLHLIHDRIVGIQSGTYGVRGESETTLNLDLAIIHIAQTDLFAERIQMNALSMRFRSVQKHVVSIAHIYRDFEVVKTFLMEQRLAAIILIMPLDLTVYLVSAIKSADLSVGTIVTWHFGRDLLHAIEANSAVFFVQPMVWSPPIEETYRPSTVFSTFEKWRREYVKGYLNISVEFHYLEVADKDHDHEFASRMDMFTVLPPLTAIQITSAGELYTSALMHASDPDNTSAVAAAINRSEGCPTLLGQITFGPDGKRWNGAPYFNNTISSQWKPLPKTTFPPKRYVDASLKAIVNNVSELKLPPTANWTRVQEKVDVLEYPMWPWAQIHLFLYPCDAGCQWVGRGCFPCEEGGHRPNADKSCLKCPHGRYTLNNGSDKCHPCPVGAECVTNWGVPIAKKGWYRYDAPEGTRNTTVNLEMESDGTLYKVCKYETRVEGFAFVKCTLDYCEGDNKCTDNNTGFLCGECVDGYSFLLQFPGARKCQECPNEFWYTVRRVCLFLAYVILCYLFEKVSAKTATSRTSGLLGILRATFWNVHLWGNALEATEKDTMEFMMWIMAPLDIIYRPLDLLPTDCFVGKGQHRTEYLQQQTTYVDISCVFGLLCLTATGILHTLARSVLRGVIQRMKVTIARSFQKTRASVANAYRDDLPATIDGRPSSSGIDSSKNNAGSATVGYADSTVDSVNHMNSASEQYSVFYGPGAIFSRQSILRDLIINWCKYARISLIWLLILYPPTIRFLFRNLGCDKAVPGVYKAQPLLHADYKILCDSPEYKVLRLRTVRHLYALVVITPAVFSICLYCISGKVYNSSSRQILGIFTEGYRRKYYWWELVQILRSVAFAASAELPDEKKYKQMILCGLCTIFLFLQIAYRPHTRQDRALLAGLDFWGVFVAFVIIALTLLEEGFYGIAADIGMNWITSKEAKHVLHSIMVASVFRLVWLHGSLFIFKAITQSLDMYEKCGMYINYWTRLFLRLSRRSWGLNDISIHRDEAGYVRLDSTDLTAGEHKELVKSLEIFSSAIGQHMQGFRPDTLKKCLELAFLRAMNSRSNKVRDFYQRYGTYNRNLMDLGPMSCGGALCEGCFGVQQPNPDAIPTDADDGVTIEELQYALSDTAEDFHFHLQAPYAPLSSSYKMADGNTGVSLALLEEYQNLEVWTEDQEGAGKIRVQRQIDQFDRQGSSTSNMCNRYAHDFRPEGTVMIGSGWICGQSLFHGGCYFDSHRPPDGTQTSRWRCARCGLDVCGRDYTLLVGSNVIGLRVTIDSIVWVKGATVAGNPYVCIDTAGRKASRKYTGLGDPRHPVFNYSEEFMDLECGDALCFKIRATRSAEQHHSDEVLGSVELPWDRYEQHGFVGLLKILGHRGTMLGDLQVKVEVFRDSSAIRASQRLLHDNLAPNREQIDIQDDSVHLLEREVKELEFIESRIQQIETRMTQSHMSREKSMLRRRGDRELNKTAALAVPSS